MLTYGEINTIKEKVMDDYINNFAKYKMFWDDYKKDICYTKYSEGGDVFPFGIYFVNKITEREYNQKPGCLMDNSKKYDFEYCFSSDSKLKIITKRGKNRTFLINDLNAVALFKYDISMKENETKDLIGIGYNYINGDREIFVYANSFMGYRKFFFDIEELIFVDKSMIGYSYHLASDDYSLLYGEDTPNKICDDCSVFHF